MDESIEDSNKVSPIFMSEPDARVDRWFMMSSPWPSLVICVLYVYLTRLGPSLMGDRKPFDIKNILIFYNLCMVALSMYILVEFLAAGWATGYSLACQPVDYSRSPKAMRMASTCWWFYMSKFIELFDTLFFILRKKYNQVSFLHVFHHGIMPVSWWFGVKYVPGGFGTFHAMCNSFIHTVMYTYYGLSALGPTFQKYLWWKKYMTKLQLTQFIIVFIHAMQLQFIDCDYPKIFTYVIASYSLIFLGMFARFYVQAYIKSHPRKRNSIDVKHAISKSSRNGLPAKGE